jgi:hypothetical protein
MPRNLTNGWYLILQTLRFYTANLPAILFVMSFAAAGRALQLGAAGPPDPLADWTLEVIVEGARILLVLFLIGQGNIVRGPRTLQTMLRMKSADWKLVWNRIASALRTKWPGVAFSLVLFGGMAWGLNSLVEAVARHPGLLAGLRRCGYLAKGANDYGVLLFLKNLTIIPLTLVFDYVLVMYVTERRQVTL